MENVNKRTSALFILASVLLCPGLATATPVDLSSWSSAQWGSLAGVSPSELPLWQTYNAPVSNEVRQLNNNAHNPSVFVSDFDLVAGTRISGQMRVGLNQPGFPDDDYFGFVFGFNIGDELNPNADFLLMDWKKQASTENPGDPFGPSTVTGEAGMALTRVEGVPNPAEFFAHDDRPPGPGNFFPGSLLELQRANTLASVGWVDNQVYDFAFEYGFNNDIRLFIDNVLELDYQWDPLLNPFAGKFGFYSFSQADSRFSNIQMESLNVPNPVPGPATFGLMLFGLVGLGLAGRKRH